MARYQITGGSRNCVEHFWSGGKYHRVEFDGEGVAHTEDEDVVAHYKSRDHFPNVVPYDSPSMGYSVWKLSE